MIKRGVDVNSTNKLGQTPLHLACGKNRVSNMRVLFASTDLEVNAKDNYGVTPLIRASFSSAAQAAQFLLEESHERVKMNEKDSRGYTALHYAMEDGNVNLGLLLISHNAHTEVNNSNEKTPLDLLEDVNFKSIVANYIEQRNKKF